MPAFVLKQINYPSAIDPIVAYEVNQELSHAFLKRYLWKGIGLSNDETIEVCNETFLRIKMFLEYNITIDTLYGFA